MKILQITKKFPWPLKDGEVIGIMNLTLGFSALGHDVTVLSINTKKHYFDPQKLPDHISSKANFKSEFVNTDIRLLAALRNLFSSKSYHIERFYSASFKTRLIETLSESTFDFILVEGIYPMQYIETIKRYTSVPVVLRPHNVEYLIWERLAVNTVSPIKKYYLALLAKRLRQFELTHISKADALVPVSSTDESFFSKHGFSGPIQMFPIGYDFKDLPPISENEKNAIGYIGGLDWIPNLEGIEWFITNVWPIVKKTNPNASFYLAGRHIPETIRHLKVEGVHILGEVENAQEFICSNAIFIVPLFAGSGMRVKIIESMAMGRAIVTTTIGAEGIEFEDGKNLLIANTPVDFASAIETLLLNRTQRLTLGQNAQKLILAQYDNRKICNELIEFVKTLSAA